MSWYSHRASSVQSCHLFETSFQQVAGGSFGFHQLLGRGVGVDVGRVLEGPYGTPRGVVPVVERLLVVGDEADGALDYHLASGDAVALMEVSSGSGSLM